MQSNELKVGSTVLMRVFFSQVTGKIIAIKDYGVFKRYYVQYGVHFLDDTHGFSSTSKFGFQLAKIH